MTSEPAANPVAVSSGVDPTETDLLRALEAGWDELLLAAANAVRVLERHDGDRRVRPTAS